MARGYFGVGIENSKTPPNLGTLWRTADILGASFIFTIGRRYKRQSSDTRDSAGNIPLFEYETINDWKPPYNCMIVGVEMLPESRTLSDFTHPERAVYVLGAEDHGLTKAMIERCHATVQIPVTACLNVAVAGSIVLYDRFVKTTLQAGVKNVNSENVA